MQAYIYKACESMKCNKCEEELLGNKNFCKECGNIVSSPEVINEKYQPEYKKHMNAFCSGMKAINNMPSDEMWDSTVARYMLTVQKARKIAEMRNLKRYFTSNFFEGLDAFMQRCTKKEFHIAFVGAIKAGKSTLINALLDRELASVSVTPETASLTKFRSTKNKDYIKVSFFNKQEWLELWESVKNANAKVFMQEYEELKADEEKDKLVEHEDIFEEYDSEEDLKEAIKKWTSSKCATHYFVKEVEVGLKSLDIPEQIVYVDTPGLDDPVQYRSDITRKYIDRANVVLVCVRAAALTGQELQTIYRVFANTRYNLEKVFILGTQIDTLRRPKSDWEEQREVWMKHLSGINCYNSKELAFKNLIPISGYLYSVANKYRDNQVTEDELDDLLYAQRRYGYREFDEKEAVEKLKTDSNIQFLRSRMVNEMLNNANKIMLLDIKEKYKLCKKEIVESFSDIKLNQLELIRLADSGMEEIRSKLEKSQKSLEENMAEKNEFDEILKNFKNTAEKRAQELFRVIGSLNK